MDKPATARRGPENSGNLDGWDREQTTNLDVTDADTPPGDPAGDAGAPAENPAPPRAIAWLQASEAELAGLNFEAPIAGSTSPTFDALSEARWPAFANPAKPRS